MIQHYLLIFYRSFLRSKGYFLINLAGLAAGMTCTLLIYLWVQDELGMNKFHANDKDLYQVMEHQVYADNLLTTSSTPGILAENLKIDFPEVELSSTTTWINDYTLSVGEHNVKAKGYHVGADYFQMFSYKLIAGAPENVLKDKLSVVITKSLAERLFKTGDAVGKTFQLNHDKSFNVTGVMEDTPNNSSWRFDFVMTFEFYKDDNEWVTQWGNNGPSTYIKLKEGSDPKALEAKIKEYVKGKEKDSNVTLFLAKFSDRYLYGNYTAGIQSGGRITYVKLFSVIAIFILVIACINFMNLSTARASRKSKEIGIKKSVGAGRRSLIAQYLSESLVTSALALLISLLIVYFVLPAFNSITDKHIVLNLLDPSLLVWLVSITLITGLLAGSYPALYLSGFQPAAVLKGGALKGSIGELWARKGLVVFQFFLSVILIVAVIVVYKQIEYVQTENLGYDKENLIQFPREGILWKENNLETFLTELRRTPGVKAAASIGHGLLGQNSNTSGLDWKGKDPEARILFENVGTNYETLETMGVTFVDGHGFTERTAADTSKIIFNEAGIKAMGLENPVGEHIRLWDEYDLEIIGVVKDFHFQSMHEPVKPLFFRFRPSNTWNILVRLEAGKEQETLKKISDFYASFNPGFTLEYKFQDVEYAQLYAAEQRVATLSSYFASMAVVISCLGLFGLAAFTAERRLKEIGIRKALGSSSTSIVLLLSKDFTMLVLVSVILGLPLAYFALDKWLATFAFRIPLSIIYFVSSGVTAIAIAWITVASQAIRASRINPVKCLRTE